MAVKNPILVFSVMRISRNLTVSTESSREKFHPSSSRFSPKDEI